MTDHSNDSEPRDTIPCLPPYSDADLDAAMRELEELEAAEAEARYQRKTRFYGLSRAWRAAMAAMGLALAMGFAGAANADEKPRVKRPTMCLTGQPVGGKDFTGFICLDGKRPRIFTRYIVVEFVDENGKPRSYVLGWTAPVKRTAKGGYVAEGTPSVKTLPL